MLEKSTGVTALHICRDILNHNRIHLGNKMPYIFIFIDDLDYIEDIWYDLVMSLSVFMSLPFVTPVLAFRPRLASIYFSCADNRIQREVRGAGTITVDALPIKILLAQRLQEFRDSVEKPAWKRIVEIFFPDKTSLRWLLERAGLRCKGHFSYPFVPKLENFISKSSNGNALVMLDMIIAFR